MAYRASPSEHIENESFQDLQIYKKSKLLEISPFKTPTPPKVEIVQKSVRPPDQLKVQIAENQSFQDNDILN